MQMNLLELCRTTDTSTDKEGYTLQWVNDHMFYSPEIIVN